MTTLTPVKDGDAWVITMPPEMAHAAGVAEGSMLSLHFVSGAIAVEILPPATEELRAEVRRIADKFKDAFAEMKRRGD
jgi:antitoxin component of MazEF toxin-antitoxin module